MLGFSCLYFLFPTVSLTVYSDSPRKIEIAAEGQNGRLAQLNPSPSAATSPASPFARLALALIPLPRSIHLLHLQHILLCSPLATPKISAHLLHSLALFNHQVVEEVALLSVAGRVLVEV